MRLLTCKLRRRGEQDAFREVGEWGVPKFASRMEQELSLVHRWLLASGSALGVGFYY